MRLFVAVELDEAARTHLVKVQRRLAGAEERARYVTPDDQPIRWVAAENLHVTVKFFGEVTDSEIEPLTRELLRISFAGASLIADHLICLPPKGAVWIVGAGLACETEVLEKLHLDLEDRCEPLGFRREGRKYLPHITIGRRKRKQGHGSRGMPRRYYYSETGIWPGPPFRAETFVLMRSELRPEGSVYTPVARFPQST